MACSVINKAMNAKENQFLLFVSCCYIVPLGSIPELPAETCKEIKASEGGHAVSGKYWFDSILVGDVVFAHCDMETEGKLKIYKTCFTSPPFNENIMDSDLVGHRSIYNKPTSV